MRRAEASSSRVYRRLLALYPHEFRARYEDAMVQLFDDQLRDARAGISPSGAVRTWLRALRDVVVTAASERIQGRRNADHGLTDPPSASNRAIGLLGVFGGLILVVGSLFPLAAPIREFQWLILYFSGAIALAVAVHRRQAVVSRRLSAAVVVAVVLANGMYLTALLVTMVRGPFAEQVRGLTIVGTVALAAVWLADAAFGLVAWRLGVVTRVGALTLTIGSILALLAGVLPGTDPAAREALARLLALAFVLNGLGWILLGIDVASRKRAPVPPPYLAPAEPT